MNYKISSDRQAAVARDYTYFPMQECPVGVKVLLLGPGDVATISQWDGRDRQWQGWFPMPKKLRQLQPGQH